MKRFYLYLLMLLATYFNVACGNGQGEQYSSCSFFWIVVIAIVAVLYHYTKKASKRKENGTRPAQPNSNEGVESPKTRGNEETTTSNDVAKKLDVSEPQQTPKLRPRQAPPINQMAAKTAFLNNIQRFIPKLNSLLDGTYEGNDWTDEVIDINEPNLIEYWKKAYKESRAVQRVLSGWGLKPDMCTSFVCMDLHKEMYNKADGSSIETGLNYTVIKHCWILTQTNPDGRVEKKVIVKGVVE